MNKLTNQVQPGDLIIVAGETIEGETLLALNMAKDIANKRKSQVAMFIGERSNDYIATLMERVEKNPIFLGPYFELNIQKLCLKVKDLKVENKDLSLIVIDSLQYLLSEKYRNNTDHKLHENSKLLKTLANELNVIILACPSLNRELNKLESKAIGSKENFVVSLSKDEMIPSNENGKTLVSLHIKKPHTHGGYYGELKFPYYDKERFRFENMA